VVTLEKDRTKNEQTPTKNRRKQHSLDKVGQRSERGRTEVVTGREKTTRPPHKVVQATERCRREVVRIGKRSIEQRGRTTRKEVGKRSCETERGRRGHTTRRQVVRVGQRSHDTETGCVNQTAYDPNYERERLGNSMYGIFWNSPRALKLHARKNTSKLQSITTHSNRNLRSQNTV